jgi:hypothetical protein
VGKGNPTLLSPTRAIGDELTHSPIRLAASARRRHLGLHRFKKFAGLGALLALLLAKKATKLFGGYAFGPHVSEDDVKREISNYVDGRASLEQLDTWLTERTWNDPETPRLAHEAQLLISEATQGHRDDLAQDLRRLAARMSKSEAVLS